MNKIQVKRDIKHIDIWTFNGLSIDDAKRTFSEALDDIDDIDHWEDIHLSVEGNEYEQNLVLWGKRLETDKEYKSRMSELRKAEAYQAKIKERELKELARLKKKYENS